MADPSSGWTGRRLGAYQMQGLLGAGGMGEVYRARDTKLGRDVAIKILPDAFTHDPDRLARFEREARVLASLNHPHIGAIYGLEEGDGVKALVLELVEGETLADRVSRGPLSVTDALVVARQMADALDAAHEKGIVHRDLKPANVILQGGPGSHLNVKLLDFGLAKLTGAGMAGGAREDELSQEPTVTAGGTREGTILGTPSYMSPEQARGHAVDKRTDIWAFGCVLYEMLTGRRVFAGATMSDTIAAIIEREPKWDVLPGATPPRIRDLLRRCLQKDPGKRLRDIGDARTDIDETLEPPSRSRRSGGWPLAAAAIVIMLAAGVFWSLRTDRGVSTDPSQWEQITNFPDSATQPALSPDGRMLTFLRGPGTFQSQGQVYVKLLPEGESVPLTSDTLTKMSPVFSPDGTRVAYTVNDVGEPWNTWIVPTLRGKPGRWLHNASGLTWTGAGQLLFSEVRTGTAGHMSIVTSTEDRSTARVVYSPPHQSGMAHRSALSPDGRSVLLAEMDERGVFIPCRLVPLDGRSIGQSVGPAGARCTEVAWARDGRWMYFSADAGDGFHIWRQRSPADQPEQITFGPSVQEGLALTPDGRSLITSVGLRQRGIRVHEATGEERQISGEGYAFWPLFSSDGRIVCYRRAAAAVTGRAATELWMTELDSGHTERLFPGQLVTQYDVSPDDRIVASVEEADGKNRLWLAWLDGHEPPRRIPGVEGISPRFGGGGEIWFNATEGSASFLFVIRDDGTGLRKVSGAVDPVMGSSSPDGEWASALASQPGGTIMTAFSSRGRPSVPIGPSAAVSRLRWTPDGRKMYLSIQVGEASAFGTGRTYVLPLPSGSMLPQVPAGGFRSEAEIAAVPGVEILPYGDVALAPSGGGYAYSRDSITRNLYRIPLP